jgi:hypothetical protein
MILCIDINGKASVHLKYLCNPQVINSTDGFISYNQNLMFLLCVFLTLFLITLYVAIVKKSNFKILSLSVTEYLMQNSFGERWKRNLHPDR